MYVPETQTDAADEDDDDDDDELVEVEVRLVELFVDKVDETEEEELAEVEVRLVELVDDELDVDDDDEDEDDEELLVYTDRRLPAPQYVALSPAQRKLQSVAGAGTEPAPKELPHQHSRAYSTPKYVYAAQKAWQIPSVIVSEAKVAADRARTLVASVWQPYHLYPLTVAG